MHKQNRLALAITAGLAVLTPAVVHAQCPTPVSGIISITGSVSGDVSGSSLCELQDTDSLSVSAEGVLSVTADGDGGQAVGVASGATGGSIEISGEVSLIQPLDSLIPNGISTRLAGVLVPNDASLTDGVSVSGKVSVEGVGAVRGVAVSGQIGGSVEISGEVSADTSTTTIVSDGGHYGLLVSDLAWTAPVSIADTGVVSGYRYGVALLGVPDGVDPEDESLGSFINDGTVQAPVGSGVGGGVLVQGTNLATFTNTNAITAVNEQSLGDTLPRDGVDVGNLAFIETLTNEGTITSLNGGHGIHLSDKYSDVEALINEAGAVVQAISEPESGATGAGLRISGAQLDQLVNEGTISGTAAGLELSDGDKYLSGITELINLGTIEGDVHDIVSPSRNLSNPPPIDTLVNAQSGLTFTGRLPGEYVIYARSPSEYGSLSATNVSGVMTFKLSSEGFEATVADDTLYPAVLVGVSDENLTSESFSDITDGLEWSLLPRGQDGTTWDLCVGECTLPVPTTSPWGLGLLGGLLGLWGFLGLRRRAVS